MLLFGKLYRIIKLRFCIESLNTDIKASLLLFVIFDSPKRECDYLNHSQLIHIHTESVYELVTQNHSYRRPFEHSFSSYTTNCGFEVQKITTSFCSRFQCDLSKSFTLQSFHVYMQTVSIYGKQQFSKQTRFNLISQQVRTAENIFRIKCML